MSAVEKRFESVAFDRIPGYVVSTLYDAAPIRAGWHFETIAWRDEDGDVVFQELAFQRETALAIHADALRFAEQGSFSWEATHCAECEAPISGVNAVCEACHDADEAGLS